MFILYVAGIQSVMIKAGLCHTTYISLTYKYEFFIFNPRVGSNRIRSEKDNSEVTGRMGLYAREKKSESTGRK